HLLAESAPQDRVVVFSDLSGYTALSESNQPAALTLAALFHKIARDAAAKRGGRVVKTIGDAGLLAFAEIPHAIAAIGRLHADYDRAVERLGLPRLALHSGVHFGPVIEARDGDIYGATVNLAARLQGLAKADEIVVSEPVAFALAD